MTRRPSRLTCPKCGKSVAVTPAHRRLYKHGANGERCSGSDLHEDAIIVREAQ